MDGSTLKEAAMASGEVDESTYDKVMDPKGMAGQGYTDAWLPTRASPSCPYCPRTQVGRSGRNGKVLHYVTSGRGDGLGFRWQRTRMPEATVATTFTIN